MCLEGGGPGLYVQACGSFSRMFIDLCPHLHTTGAGMEKEGGPELSLGSGDALGLFQRRSTEAVYLAD